MVDADWIGCRLGTVTGCPTLERRASTRRDRQGYQRAQSRPNRPGRREGSSFGQIDRVVLVGLRRPPCRRARRARALRSASRCSASSWLAPWTAPRSKAATSRARRDRVPRASRRTAIWSTQPSPSRTLSRQAPTIRSTPSMSSTTVRICHGSKSLDRRHGLPVLERRWLTVGPLVERVLEVR